MTRPINVAVLGATGSIGQQTLDVIDRNPGRFKLFGLTEGVRSTNRQAEFLVQGKAGESDFDAQVEAMVTDPRCDLVVVAIPGARALMPTMSALKAGKEVALATKEVLVMAGALVMKAAAGRAQGAFPIAKSIRPIDSEHSAIWQCLWGEERENVRRLILTASGGPFWAHPDLDLDQVTVEQALNHPRWSMGPKVTVDSATLMNKGLELIEAHHCSASQSMRSRSASTHRASCTRSSSSPTGRSRHSSDGPTCAYRSPSRLLIRTACPRLCPRPPSARSAGWSFTSSARAVFQASGSPARPRSAAGAVPPS